MTAAAVPIQIGGQEYLMSPLTDQDISEIDEWLRARVIRAAMQAIPGNAEAGARDAALAQAMKVAMTISWVSGDGPKMMSSVDGIARILWQSLKHRHPKVVYEELRAQMFDAANVAEFNRGFKQVTGLSPDEKKGSRRRREK